MKKFAIYLIVILTVFISCKKSIKDSNTTTSNDNSKPIKSITVTYPAIISDIDTSFNFYKVVYTFSKDSIYNAYHVNILDTFKSSPDANSFFIDKTVKTYFFSGTSKKQVSKITNRTESFKNIYPASDTWIVGGNFDILFEYDTITNSPLIFPNKVTVINYKDNSASTISNSVVFNSINDYNPNYGYVNFPDIINCKLLVGRFKPGPTCVLYNGNDYLQYYQNNDSSIIEINESFPNYYTDFFENITPSSPLWGIYYFNKDNLCTTYALDITAGSTSIYKGQRKFDFDYSNTDNNIINLFSSKYNLDNLMLYFENYAEQSTTMRKLSTSPYDYWSDAYVNSMFSYHRDICSSYTDSLFSIDNNGNKNLESADKFVNTITKDSHGNIINIKCIDKSNLVFRNIDIDY